MRKVSLYRNGRNDRIPTKAFQLGCTPVLTWPPYASPSRPALCSLVSSYVHARAKRSFMTASLVRVPIEAVSE